MTLEEINKQILDLKKIRKKKFGISLNDVQGKLNTLKRSQELHRKILEHSCLTRTPIYLLCEDIDISTSVFYRLQKHRVGTTIEGKIVNYFKNLEQ